MNTLGSPLPNGSSPAPPPPSPHTTHPLASYLSSSPKHARSGAAFRCPQQLEGRLTDPPATADCSCPVRGRQWWDPRRHDWSRRQEVKEHAGRPQQCYLLSLWPRPPWRAALLCLVLFISSWLLYSDHILIVALPMFTEQAYEGISGERQKQDSLLILFSPPCPPFLHPLYASLIHPSLSLFPLSYRL